MFVTVPFVYNNCVLCANKKKNLPSSILYFNNHQQNFLGKYYVNLIKYIHYSPTSVFHFKISLLKLF